MMLLIRNGGTEENKMIKQNAELFWKLNREEAIGIVSLL